MTWTLNGARERIAPALSRLAQYGSYHEAYGYESPPVRVVLGACELIDLGTLQMDADEITTALEDAYPDHEVSIDVDTDGARSVAVLTIE